MSKERDIVNQQIKSDVIEAMRIAIEDSLSPVAYVPGNVSIAYKAAEAGFAALASELQRLRGEVEGLTALASREGWVMVPVKPTEAMIDNAVGTLTVLNGSEWELARQFYAAMISSAPKPEG